MRRVDGHQRQARLFSPRAARRPARHSAVLRLEELEVRLTPNITLTDAFLVDSQDHALAGPLLKRHPGRVAASESSACWHSSGNHSLGHADPSLGHVNPSLGYADLSVRQEERSGFPARLRHSRPQPAVPQRCRQLSAQD